MKSPKYIAWVKTLNCCHCKTTGPCDAHHLIDIGLGAMGGKAPDIAAVPLCGGIEGCHGQFHADPLGWPQAKWLILTLTQAIEDGVIKI